MVFDACSYHGLTILVCLILYYGTSVLSSATTCKLNAKNDPPVFEPQNVETFQDSDDRNSSTGLYSRRYFRYFYTDKRQQNLYVGAMQYLYRLPLSNISSPDSKRSQELFPYDNEIENCLIKKGPTGLSFHCQNHVRSIAEDDSGNLYACGTGAYSPRDFKLQINSLTTVVNGTRRSGVLKCPFDPDDNGTSIWIDSGNPLDKPTIYSATVADFTKSDPVIYRPELNASVSLLRTVKHDSKWLNEPDFIRFFDVGDYVFVFFRETAVEYINCGKAKFARVARICKKDLGGKNVLKERWTTFMKARLNCSLPGEFPYYFDELQDVIKDNESDTFYAVFTTNLNGLYGSAVCAFSLNKIQDIFDNGAFKYQKDSSSNWLAVQPSDVPTTHKPGQCINNSQELPIEVLTFMKGRTLMDLAVPSVDNRPRFYIRDIVFRKIAVQMVTINSQSSPLLYLASNQGHIYKVATWGSGADVKNNIVSVWTPFSSIYPIWSFYYQSDYLYVAADISVKQIPVKQCSYYAQGSSGDSKTCKCCTCVKDPHCGWDNATQTCQPYREGLLTSVTSDKCSVCETIYQTDKSNELLNSAMILSHRITILQNTNKVNCDWYKKNGTKTKIIMVDQKYESSRVNSLIIYALDQTDNGDYECCDPDNSNIIYDAYTIKITEAFDEITVVPNYVNKYNEWIKDYQTWKQEFNTWKTACTKK